MAATTPETLSPNMPALRKRRSLWGDAWSRMVASPNAVIGMTIVLIFILITVAAHFFWQYDPKADLDYSLKLNAPSAAHLFGTDKLGRDIFRRVIHGGWNSLRVGIVAVGVSLFFGSFLGLIAGFYESMPVDRKGRALLIGGIGLILGGLPAWMANQVVQAVLFGALGVAAAMLEELWAGQLAKRAAVFAAAGLAIGGLLGLLVTPLMAAACGLVGACIGALVALPLGGGLLSNLIMRAMDILLAFPGILLAITIVAFLGPGLDKTMIAIGIVSIPTYARLMRSTVLAVVRYEYVTAALAVGVEQGRILFRHILPNCLSPIIVQATMGLASAILWAGALGFLGLGAIPPEPEWGAMLGDSYRYLTTGAWWAVTFPGLAIMLSVLGFNLLGDGLRDALDPRLTR